MQDASAEDLLLALLRASTLGKDDGPSSAQRPEPATEAELPAKEASSALRGAAPELAAAANRAPAPPQQVCASFVDVVHWHSVEMYKACDGSMPEGLDACPHSDSWTNTRALA